MLDDALDCAIKHNKLENLNPLVLAGADPNYQQGKGFATALSAIRCDALQVVLLVEELARLGGKPERVDIGIIATKIDYRNADAVVELARRGLNVAGDPHLLARTVGEIGHKELATVLVGKGADPLAAEGIIKRRDPEGAKEPTGELKRIAGAPKLDAELRQTEILCEQIYGGPIEMPLIIENWFRGKCAESGPDTVKKSLAICELSSEQKQAGLEAALRAGRPKNADVLLNAGIIPTAKNLRTALSIAPENPKRCKACIDILLAAHAPANQLTSTDLLNTLTIGTESIVQKLIEAGTVVKGDKQLLLENLRISGNKELARCLLENGADNQGARIALKQAWNLGTTEETIFARLEGREPNQQNTTTLSDDWNNAVRTGNKTQLEVLSQNTNKANLTTEQSMLIAIEDRRTDIVQYLVDNNAPISIETTTQALKKGMTKSQVKKTLHLPWYTMLIYQNREWNGESQVEVIGSWPPGFWMNSGKQVVLYFDKRSHLSG